jgi:hypothetical protein
LPTLAMLKGNKPVDTLLTLSSFLYDISSWNWSVAQGIQCLSGFDRNFHHKPKAVRTFR